MTIAQVMRDHLSPTQRRTEVHESRFGFLRRPSEVAQFGLLNRAASSTKLRQVLSKAIAFSDQFFKNVGGVVLHVSQ